MSIKYLNRNGSTNTVHMELGVVADCIMLLKKMKYIIIKVW